MSASASVLAPAKINLFLRVLHKRSDGYHELDTLFQAIALYDRVTVEISGTGVDLEVSGFDTGPDHGGFCCIPGSHKSNYKLPDAIKQNIDAWPCVLRPEAPAGSVILFTESLTHATYDWNADHQRRSLLYKYCVSHTAWKSDRVEPPEGIELSWRQKILFGPPGDPLRHFPSLFEKPKED